MSTAGLFLFVLCVSGAYSVLLHCFWLSVHSQLSISLVTRGLCSTVSGQAKVHAMQIYTNGVLPNHLPAIVISDRP